MSAQIDLDLTERRIVSLGGLGILNAHDLEELNAGTMRVFQLMRDGQWHSAEEIRIAAGRDGYPATEGLRRMRDLRKFFTIERDRLSDKRDFRYRLARLA